MNKDIDKKCATCGGSKKIDFTSAETGQVLKITCPDCNGDGTTERDDENFEKPHRWEKQPVTYQIGYSDGYNSRNDQIAKLQDQIEGMRCCGNCGNLTYSMFAGEEPHCNITDELLDEVHIKCDNWTRRQDERHDAEG